MSRARADHGFTLIEVLVTIALSSIVFGATLSVLDVFQTNNRRDQLRNEVQDNARSAMDRISRQLRNVAAPSSGAPGALLVTRNYSMIFDTIDSNSSFAWGENKAHMMMVRYCLNNTTNTNEVLWYQVKRWNTVEGPKEAPTTKECPDLSGYWESSSQLVQHVTNRIATKTQPRPAFIYSAATAPQTASVEVNLFLDLTPGQAHPGETQLTSGIGLRNANRPPIAEFTVTELANHAVRLDASASYDPDGLALTYKWCKDGTPQESSTQVYETVKAESSGTHSYKLEVTDPGGLSESKEQVWKIP
jgi:prepilin-type N-terminal cleavage/methylation domain-containing protein